VQFEENESERSERATRPERGDPAGEPMDQAVGSVRQAGERVSAANEPRDRSAPTERRASERVGEFEGRSPSIKKEYA
jgi:hypothetical protein